MSLGTDSTDRSGFGAHGGAVGAVRHLQDRLVGVCDRRAVDVTYLAFAFVFFYFGLQKPMPVTSPVAGDVHAFVSALGLPAAAAPVFIGYYEMTLGVLFFLRRLRLAFFVFLAHQATTLLVLVVVPEVAFQPPYLHVLGLRIPWAFDWMAAYVLKNLVFVGAFMLLASAELGDGPAGQNDAAGGNEAAGADTPTDAD